MQKVNKIKHLQENYERLILFLVIMQVPFLNYNYSKFKYLKKIHFYQSFSKGDTFEE